ncbi:hypothetical protein [Streptomyces coelicoflavus]|uniref:hypothetical protein n=1 Tax=Streptomyces coelicoflavus TaxID=285562 RepID=UPI00331A7A18
MPVKGSVRTTSTAGTAALILGSDAVVLGAPAQAEGPTGNGQGASIKENGGRDGSGIHSAVRIEYTGSVATNAGSGNVTSADVNWSPPPCWYAPYLGAKDGEGMFWAGVENPDEPDILKRSSCTELPFWVDNGEAPPPQYERAITPEILAALAYQHMKLPGTEVTLAPAQTTKVNLPTWAWLDKTDFHEIRATASINVPGFALTATTTAKPMTLKLEPGTPDAETYPASGECVINTDGSIGEPYAKGKADQTPPCGIRYLRSSGDGTFENAQAVTVQETQAVNR